MNSPNPFRPSGHPDDQAATYSTLSRAAASIEQARGVLAWQYDLTMDQAGVLLALLAGARRQPVVRTARSLVREAGTRPTVG